MYSPLSIWILKFPHRSLNVTAHSRGRRIGLRAVGGHEPWLKSRTFRPILFNLRSTNANKAFCPRKTALCLFSSRYFIKAQPWKLRRQFGWRNSQTSPARKQAEKSSYLKLMVTRYLSSVWIIITVKSRACCILIRYFPVFYDAYNYNDVNPTVHCEE